MFVRPTPHARPIIPAAVLSLIAGVLSLGIVGPAQAAPSTGLMISQVYSAGGNSGATYNADFVELHNSSSQPISLANKSLQYRSPTNTAVATNVFPLPDNVSVPAGGYFLIQGTVSGTAAGAPLPAQADLSTGLAAGAAAGQVYLADTVAGINPISPSGSVTSGGSIDYSPGKVIDFFGYGATTTATTSYEAAPNSKPTSSTKSYRRATPPVDTDNNNADFVSDNVAVGSPGNTIHNCDCLAPSALKITEVYTEGGKPGAAYDHDYVEIQNTGSAALSMAGLSLQYQAPGTSGAATKLRNLSGTMAGSSFDVIQLGTEGSAGQPVPFDEGYEVNAPNLDKAGGTLFIAKATSDYNPGTGDTTTKSEQFRGDLVGWASGSSFEKLAVDAAASTATTSLQRANGGVDSDNNAADFDFFGASPNAQPAIPSVTIPQIQGTGPSSPMNGANVSVQGVVTAAYPNGPGSFNGFYLQTPGYDPANDATPKASDGIFVYTGTSTSYPTPTVGQHVSISSAKVSEFSSMTELTTTNPSNLTVRPATAQEAVTAGTVIPGTDCALPGADCLTGDDLESAREAHEGELFKPRGPTTVSDSYDGSPWTQPTPASFQMKGEIGLAANSSLPLIIATEIANPGTQPTLHAQRGKYNEAHKVTLDDGANIDYSASANSGLAYPWLTPTNTVRIGAGVSFHKPVVFENRNNLWKLQPQQRISGDGSAEVSFEQDRPAGPADVLKGEGNLKIATANVLNYFPTYGEKWVADASTPGNRCTWYTDRANARITVNNCDNPNDATILGPRGAATEASFKRQQAKIVKEINTIDADVLGLEEVENSTKMINDVTGDRDAALKKLVAALNAAHAADHPDSVGDRWAYVPSPPPSAQPTLLEQDAIRAAFIYNPAKVELHGKSQILINSAPFRNAREPLAQAFKLKGAADSDAFAVIVNHFKSKGDSSGTAAGDNADKGDGVGSYNGDRKRQAQALLDFTDQFISDRGIDKVFMAGDYNSYSQEDPIKLIEAAGYHSLESDSQSASHTEMSYAFGGLTGSLDHVFANGPALAMVTGADSYEINANEPVFYEYSRYNSNLTNLYAENQYRASDHNPEVIGVKAPKSPLPELTDDFQLLATNDFHGRLKLNEAGTDAGVARLAGAVKELRQDNPQTLFAAAGDLIGGSTFESFIQQDKPTLDALNEATLDVSSVGNHEFDKGYDDLVNRVMKPYDRDSNPYGGAAWPYIGANVRKKADCTQQADGLAPTWTKTLDLDGTGPAAPIKVGFIGAVTEDLPSLVSGSAIQDLCIAPIVASVNEAADDLKADGADLIVELVHEGAATTKYASVTDNSTFAKIVSGSSPKIDAIVSGHTHLAYNHKVPVESWGGRKVTKRPVVSAGQYGSYLNRLVFQFAPGTHDLVNVDQNVINLKDYTEDPATKAIVDDAVAKADELGKQVLGKITGPFERARYTSSTGSTENRGGESTLGNLVAEAQRWATGTDLAFMNPGGLRADMLGSPQPAYPADLTYRQAADVQPFANTLVRMDLTGAEIKKILEEQWQRDAQGNVPSRPFLKLGVSKGFSYTYDVSRPEHDRITGIWLNDQKLVPSKSYSVSANSFLASGTGDNFWGFSAAKNKQDTGKIDLEEMVNFMKAYGASSPLAVDYAQRAVGVKGDLEKTYVAEDTVTLDLSSLSFTGPDDAEYNDTSVSASLAGVSLGDFAVTTAAGTVPNDEAGTAAVSVTLPQTLPARPVLLLKGNRSATVVSVPLKVASASATVSASAADVVYGGSGAVEVTVAPEGATGQVELFDQETSLGTATLSDGKAVVALAARSLEVGTHTLSVKYLGDDAFGPAESTVAVKVTKAAATVAVMASPAEVTQGSEKSTVSIAVTGANGVVATGKVSIADAGTPLGEVNLVDGQGTLEVGGFSDIGSHTLTASYDGDQHVQAASGSVILSVKKAQTPDPIATTLSASAPRIVWGAVGSVSVAVSPAAATGQVEVFEGTRRVGSGILSRGRVVVSLPARALSMGAHTLVIRYGGDVSYAAAQTTVRVLVTKAAPRMKVAKPQRVKVKEKARFVVRVSAPGFVPSGRVVLRANGKQRAVGSLRSGRVVLRPKFSKPGTYTVKLSYQGDGYTLARTMSFNVRARR